MKLKHLLLMILTVLSGLLCWKYLGNKTSSPPRLDSLAQVVSTDRTVSAPEVYVGKVMLLNDQQIDTNTLKLSFAVKFARQRPDEIRFEMDGMSIPPKAVFISTSTQKTIEYDFVPGYLLSPGNHVVGINYNINGNKYNKTYNFSVNLQVQFDGRISESEFLLIPDYQKVKCKNSWTVDRGLLHVKSPSMNIGQCSMGFILPFSDISVELEFISKSSGPLNLVFYFLDSNTSIILGNGSNKITTLMINGKGVARGINTQYSDGIKQVIRIVRKGEVYRVERVLLNGNEGILQYRDVKRTVVKDSVGIASWANGADLDISKIEITTPGI